MHTSLRKAVLAGAIAAAAAALAPAAHAISIVQNLSFGTQNVPFTNNFTFNLFDTTLGTLNAITIALTTSATTDVNVVNLTGGPVSYSNATAMVPVSVSGPGPVTVSTTPTAGPFSGVAVGLVTTIAGGTVSATSSMSVSNALFGLHSGVGLDTGTLTASSSLGQYSGSAPGGTLSFGGDATASGNFTLTYDYETSVVPVPGAAMLLGSGLLMVFGLGRHARRTTAV